MGVTFTHNTWCGACPGYSVTIHANSLEEKALLNILSRAPLKDQYSMDTGTLTLQWMYPLPPRKTKKRRKKIKKKKR